MSVSGKSVHHKTSFYVLIWAILVILLGISLPLGLEGRGETATLIIFGIATLKAFLVAYFFMGLSYEPRYLATILIIGIFFMGLLLTALIPDLVYIYGRVP